MLLRIVQAGARVSALWGYRGFGAGCRILQKLIPGRAFTIMLSHDTAFTFPFADGYWSMLLGGTDIYEPEIENFLRGIAGEDYTLLDCGANYGYWSVLASGQRFGSQRVIAIEPSSQTFSVLKENATLNGNRFTSIKKAVGAIPGVVHLSGRKHEARAVSPAADAHSESVEMTALDGLIDDGLIPAGTKLVVKLDVEGLEIAAIAGSKRLLEGDCIVICEDHGSDRNHTVSRHILEQTPLKLFCYNLESGRFESITDVGTLDRIKRFRNRGYNVFATTSPYWEKKLRAQRAVANDGKFSRTLIGSLARGHVMY